MPRNLNTVPKSSTIAALSEFLQTDYLANVLTSEATQRFIKDQQWPGTYGLAYAAFEAALAYLGPLTDAQVIEIGYAALPSMLVSTEASQSYRDLVRLVSSEVEDLLKNYRQYLLGVPEANRLFPSPEDLARNCVDYLLPTMVLRCKPVREEATVLKIDMSKVTQESVTTAMERTFSETHEWPKNDFEVVQAFLKHWEHK